MHSSGGEQFHEELCIRSGCAGRSCIRNAVDRKRERKDDEASPCAASHARASPSPSYGQEDVIKKMAPSSGPFFSRAAFRDAASGNRAARFFPALVRCALTADQFAAFGIAALSRDRRS